MEVLVDAQDHLVILAMVILILVETKVDVVGVVGHQIIVPE
jgi:hypothetical protein